jgi:dihydroorotate dehydrogenase (NAD+) catalytic subunit
MNMDPITRQDLSLKTPWMNAAGVLGFRPPRQWSWPEAPGAFVTNPISLGRRTPAEERSLLSYPGGVLLHTGLPNPGLRTILKQHGQRWARLDLPLWVHLLADEPAEVSRMVEMLEGREEIAAIELGISPKASGEEALALVRATGIELPVVVCVPLDRAREDWLSRLPDAGASAICLSAPRGTYPGSHGKLISGRLYGPGLFPLALPAVQHLHKVGLPTIAGCGVYTLENGQCLLDAGAWAVQLDLVLWGNESASAFPKGR